MSGLTPPVSDTDHRSGPEGAPATLVEYGDFECPSCGAAYPTVEQVRKKMGKRLRFVFRHFPLTHHARVFVAGTIGQGTREGSRRRTLPAACR